jgi:hypothetical protein
MIKALTDQKTVGLKDAASSGAEGYADEDEPSSLSLLPVRIPRSVLLLASVVGAVAARRRTRDSRDSLEKARAVIMRYFGRVSQQVSVKSNQ